MDYEAAEAFLFDLGRSRPKPGADSTREILSALGNPHETLACVQVAGSNGKGTTARMTEAILREAGYSVGLFTSPHLHDLRERVRVDGEKIPKSALRKYVEQIRDHVTARAATGEEPTFFEAMTALAVWYFARERVDVAVLEVGIGGRFDATSVVDPVASAVTTVTLEHTDLLGDTIEDIARDKAHVAPADAPLVTAATGTTLAAIREVAGTVVTVGQATETADVTGIYRGRTNHRNAGVSLAGPDWRVETTIPMLGAVQATNAATAATLARQTTEQLGGRPVSEQTLASGLRRADWPGRFDVMAREPLVVLDGAHNPGATSALAATLEEFEYDDLHVVAGIVRGKDHRGIANALPTPARVVACRPDTPRAADEAAVADAFREAGARSVHTQQSVGAAVVDALDAASAADLVLVTGSLYTVAAARSWWTRVQSPTLAPASVR